MLIMSHTHGHGHMVEQGLCDWGVGGVGRWLVIMARGGLSGHWVWLLTRGVVYDFRVLLGISGRFINCTVQFNHIMQSSFKGVDFGTSVLALHSQS